MLANSFDWCAGKVFLKNNYIILLRSAFLLVALLLMCCTSIATANESGETDQVYQIIRSDPRIDRLIPKDAVVEIIAEGFSWVEGPVWIHSGNYLLFSDIPNNSIFKWQDGDGVSLFLQPSGYSGTKPFKGREPGSNGLTLDPRGRLVICQHGDRRIVRLEKNGNQTTLVDHYAGKRLNSPNDAVFKSNGDLYFTDPPFGLPKAFDDSTKELEFSGVYRLSHEGVLTLLIRDIKAPNGIAFSPDEKNLYVTDVSAHEQKWLVYDVKEDGTLGNGRVFHDAMAFTKKYSGGPDGLKVDQQGNLFAAGPGGVYIFSPDASHLGLIETRVPTANVAWGDDGSTLYIAASTKIFRIKLSTKGASF